MSLERIARTARANTNVQLSSKQPRLVSCLKRALSEMKPYAGRKRVCKYYSQTGWTMFDANHLTPAIEHFLTSESVTLDSLVSTETILAYDTLIEIGCGYGRHMNWALARGLNYEGLDLVHWLTEIGQLRVKQAQQNFSALRCRISHRSIDEIEKLDITNYSRKALAFFPFNCFGNLTNIDQVLETLSSLKLDLFISTFKTDEESTQARTEYYENCGSTIAEVNRTPDGVLVVSDEGLKSIAMEANALKDKLAEFGFELAQEWDYGEIGLAFHFKHSNIQQGEDRRGGKRASKRCRIVIQALSDFEEGAGLLSFEQVEASVLNVSRNGILVQSDADWEPGTIIRLLSVSKFHSGLSLLPKASCGEVVRKMTEGNKKLYAIEFTMCPTEKPKSRSEAANKGYVIWGARAERG